MRLPVEDVLGAVEAAARDPRRVVLVAPPGAGKTTLVAPHLLRAGVVGDGQQIILLQPRRVAARTVARHIARRFGEPVGRTVGYHVRFDRQASADTRILVVTEGILTARLQSDPELTGVGAVIIDEFHERSIHADLALALVREVQEALRDDLALVVMSATLDADPVAAWLGGCPVVRSAGRAYPVDVRYLAAPVEGRVEDAVRDAVVALVDEGLAGDVLVFLPGAREIAAAQGALASPMAARGRDVDVLHGRMTAEAQDRALSPGARPRVILATNIAETSLTIEGVGAVVDSGLAKVMRYEPRLGSGRLYTERISRASADQRAGRAGRLGPGVAVRLWTTHQHQQLAAAGEPEIARVDLAATVLELKAWGVRDVADFTLLEPLDTQRVAAAEATLRLLGALDAEGAITPLGRRLRGLPIGPRLAAFLDAAARAGRAGEAARWAAAIELPTSAEASSVEARARSLEREPRTRGRMGELARRLRSAAERGAPVEGAREVSLERHLLAGFPDGVARRRAPGSDALVLATGRGARLVGEASGLGGADLLVVVELDAGRRGEGSTSYARLAAPIEAAWLEALPLYEVADEYRWDEGRERVIAERVTRYAAIALDRRPLPVEDRARAEAIVVAQALADPAAALGTLSAHDEGRVARLVTLARAYPELSLPSTPGAWLMQAIPALAAGASSFAQLRARSLGDALLGALDWRARKLLDVAVPERLEVPSGSHIRLTYQVDGPPVLAVKVQELFGQDATPTVAEGRLACVVHLLSPAGRPLQVTQDLASFWRVTWPTVRGEMRSRYPKHFWPEDPLTAPPTQRTTARSRR